MADTSRGSPASGVTPSNTTFDTIWVMRDCGSSAHVPYIPTGQYFSRTACRRDITGIIQGQFVFWNVRRT